MADSIITIAFIDPIISTTYLVEALKHKNLRLIAVYSLTDLAPEEKTLRYKPELFDHVIYVDDKKNIVPIAEQLKNLNVNYIFYGYEASVPLADKLSQLVCPKYANNPATSLFRLDKFHMQDILKEKSISHIHQMKIHNNNLVMEQLKELNDWNFPVIIKPTQGVLSIGVKKCFSVAEIAEFLNTQSHASLHSEEVLEDFVAQECLSGDEYFVDTFSLEGRHYLVSVQRYEKINYEGSPIYRYFEVVDPISEEWKSCSEYVFKVLDAVELKNGFGHTELFLTSKGPILIEVNPRISGASGFPNIMTEETLKISQPKILLDQIFHQDYSAPSKLFKFGRIVCLQNWAPKKMGEFNVDLIKTLASYHSHLMLKKPGSFLGIPSTLGDTVAFVLLININNEALLEDYNKLIGWEQNQVLF